MRQLLRKAGRRLSTTPWLGRVVHVASAIWRLPQIRAQAAITQDLDARLAIMQASVRDRLENQASAKDRLDNLQGGLDSLQDRIDSVGLKFESVYREQLPSLLEAISKLNARQHTIDQDQQNLVASVPVALRQLRRDIHRIDHDAAEVKEEVERLDATQGKQVGQLEATSARMETVASELEAASARLEAQSSRTDHLETSATYLFGRVEFVRRELMFELRYQHASPEKNADPLETAARVVATDKLAKARETGLRLNLGCGHIALDGYINVDRRELPGVDVVAEINALPSEVDSADEIFSAHVLEHFPQEQLRRELLPYWKSLLKKGGILRAVVPDAEAMIREYTTGKYPYDDMREVLYGGQDYEGDFHFNMFTPEHMTRLLEEAGFSNIQVIEAGRKNGKCFEFEMVATNP